MLLRYQPCSTTTRLLLCWAICFVVGCQRSDTKVEIPSDAESSEIATADDYSIVSPLGKKLTPGDPSALMLEKFELAKQDFDKNPDDVENVIWFGRRTAYLGRYTDAIKIYSDGISKFPNDARLYRHRGHRFISIREYGNAIQDFEKAVKLIKGTENEIEPDGLPNAQNIPVSTLHGNIWYHLGLAHYLTQDFEKAFEAYTECRNTGGNDDNIVSSTHWLYMIQRRLGNEVLAQQQLTPIQENMNVIENHGYYQLCKFYNGMISRDDLMNEEGTSTGDAVRYGVANWDLCNGNREAAKKELEQIVTSKAWSSFGFLAAEQDILNHFK